MLHRICAVCTKQLRSDNETGVCYLCQKSKRSSRRCLCGCRRVLDARNRSGFARPCFLKLALSGATAALSSK